MEYEVQVDDNLGFDSPVSYPVVSSLLEINLGDTELDDGETYFWHVRGKLNATTWGGWSEPQTFTVTLP